MQDETAVEISGRPNVETAFSRSTATVVTIQYWRALAAGLVVLHHAMALPGLIAYRPEFMGQFGVDLFFVISGFIMWTTTVDGRRGPGEFWAARVVRVVPLYWIYTTLYIAAALIVPTAVFNAALEPAFIVKSYLFVPAENPQLHAIVPVYTLGWTLNFEMFFYLVFGCGLFVGNRMWRAIIIIGVLVVLVRMRQFVTPQGAVALTYTDPMLLEFAAGILLALAYRGLCLLRPVLGWIAIGAALFWLIVSHMNTMEHLVASGLPATAMIAGGLILEPLARKRVNRFGLLLGDASYSTYLAHPFAMRAWYLVIGGEPAVVSVTGGILFVVSAAMIGVMGGLVSFLLIERRVLAAGHRLLRRR